MKRFPVIHSFEVGRFSVAWTREDEPSLFGHVREENESQREEACGDTRLLGRLEWAVNAAQKGEIQLYPKPGYLETVRVLISDLGFGAGELVNIPDLNKRVSEFGLKPCLHEVALLSTLEYENLKLLEEYHRWCPHNAGYVSLISSTSLEGNQCLETTFGETYVGVSRKNGPLNATTHALFEKSFIPA